MPQSSNTRLLPFMLLSYIIAENTPFKQIFLLLNYIFDYIFPVLSSALARKSQSIFGKHDAQR